MDSFKKTPTGWATLICEHSVCLVSGNHLTCEEEGKRRVGFRLDNTDVCSEENLLTTGAVKSIVEFAESTQTRYQWHLVGSFAQPLPSPFHRRSAVQDKQNVQIASSGDLKFLDEVLRAGIVCEMGHSSAFYLFGCTAGDEWDSFLKNLYGEADRVSKLWKILLSQSPVLPRGTGLCFQMVSTDGEDGSLSVLSDLFEYGISELN